MISEWKFMDVYFVLCLNKKVWEWFGERDASHGPEQRATGGLQLQRSHAVAGNSTDGWRVLSFQHFYAMDEASRLPRG